METEIVGVGIRMPKSLHKELRKIAFEKEISLNRLLVMGAEWISQKDFEARMDTVETVEIPDGGSRCVVHKFIRPIEVDSIARKRRGVANTYLEALHKANPHYKGISMKKRAFVNAMFGNKPISYRQLLYLIDIARDHVDFDVDLSPLRESEEGGK